MWWRVRCSGGRVGVVAGADGARAGAVLEIDDPRESLPDAVVCRCEQRHRLRLAGRDRRG